jgi:predicted 2-oxoglutarate/Fe(II)-dependent dioxygenase YbiX
MTGSGTATIGGNPAVPPPGWARVTDRIMARLRARSIDDKLLNGGVTDGSPVVLVRRARLLQRRYRSAVAASLRGLIESARRNQPNFFAAKLQLKVREVLASEPLILTLADEIEHDESV